MGTQWLQWRHEIHKDKHEHNIQILTQDNLTIKFEIKLMLNELVHHPISLALPSITAQSLPPSFITKEIIYKFDRFTRKTLGYITFYNQYSGLSFIWIFNNLFPPNPLSHFFSEPTSHKNPYPRTGPQNSLVYTMIVKKMSKKHNINQVTQCESEPQEIETTNILATLNSKAWATTLTGYKFTATFSKKKIHCFQVSNGNKNRLDHESFHQINKKEFYILVLKIVKTISID